MPAANTDLLLEVGSPGTVTTLSAPGWTTGVSNAVTVASTTNWPTGTGVAFAVDTVDSAGVQVPGSYCEFVGTVAGANSITNVELTEGDPQNYAAGSTTRVYIPVTATRENRIVEWGSVHANQDGSLKTDAVQDALGLGAADLNGWNALGYAPNTVTANGNRSYDFVFNGVDLTSTVSAGMRLRTTRTVAAPTQCTSLNGTSQYFSKSSPAGMTFTDDFVAGAWVKLSSYGANPMGVISRWNGTSGWFLYIDTNGQIVLNASNAAAANYSRVVSYQSLPLNKWVYIAAQLDMSAFTATTTTSYIMIDGVDVPASVVRAGTNPTALVQAGDFNVGTYNNDTARAFPGKIAQAFVSSAKITQANIRTLMSQGLTSALISANNIISAYSFSNSINDLNTTNANNLTANGSATATNADSPFGGQADGTISSTLDYAIVQKATFSTNTTVTVQVPGGNTLPTSGGVTSVVYSSNKAPYGMPVQKDRWAVETLIKSSVQSAAFGGLGVWITTSMASALTVPIGAWKIGYQGTLHHAATVAGAQSGFFQLSSSVPSTAVFSGELVTRAYNGGLSTSNILNSVYSDDEVEHSTATTYALYGAIDISPGGSNTWYMRGDQGCVKVFAENAYL